MKFTISGSITVTVSTESVLVDEENQNPFDSFFHVDYLLVSVQDTGIGISQEDQRYIFEPFKKIKST